MKKVINVRVSLFCAVAFILGIYSLYSYIVGRWYIGAIVVACLATFITIFACKRRHGLKILIAMLVCVFIGFGGAALSFWQLQGREIASQSVTVTGRVTDLGRNGELSNVYYLENCINNESGVKYSGKVQVYYVNHADEEDVLNTGDVVTVSGVLRSTYPVQKSVQSYLVRNRITYEMSNVTLLSRGSGLLKLDEKVRLYIFDISTQYAPNNSATLYALLTGDRNAMSSETVKDFTRAGIIHVLAVSGLHVGFIVAVVYLLLSKLRLHPLVEGALVAVPLVVYAYICGFAPSIVRAIVMVACTYVSRALLSRYDALSSLSIAAILVLIIQPFYLFDAGFQLSFLSVFGIATIYAPVDRFITRKSVNRHVRRLIDGVAVSFACSAATFFTVATCYGEVALLGVLLNIVAIPLISISFVAGLLGLLPWVFHYLQSFSDILLAVVTRIAQFVSSLSFATVTVSVLGVSILFVIIALFIAGGFVNFKKQVKRIACFTCLVLLIMCIVVSSLPLSCHNEVYITFGYTSNAIVATSQSGESAILSDFSDYAAVYKAVDYIKRHNVHKCSLYVVNYSQADANAIVLTDEITVDNIYIVSGSNFALDAYFESNNIMPVRYDNQLNTGSITVTALSDGVLRAVNVSVGKASVCSVYGNEQQIAAVLNIGLGSAAYVLPQAPSIQYNNMVFLTQLQTNVSHNYGSNKYGNFTIRQKGDTISLIFG